MYRLALARRRIVPGVGRKSEIAGLLAGIECAPQPLDAGAKLIVPGTDRMPEHRVDAGLEAVQATFALRVANCFGPTSPSPSRSRNPASSPSGLLVGNGFGTGGERVRHRFRTGPELTAISFVHSAARTNIRDRRTTHLLAVVYCFGATLSCRWLAARFQARCHLAGTSESSRSTQHHDADDCSHGDQPIASMVGAATDIWIFNSRNPVPAFNHPRATNAERPTPGGANHPPS